MNKLTVIAEMLQPYWLPVVALLILLVTYLDYTTGYELSFSLFYLLPILLASWLATRVAGIITSIVSSGCLFYADVLSGHLYVDSYIPYWNLFIRLSIFLIASLLVSALKKSHEYEKELARMDGLTGAANSRCLREILHTEMDRAHRHNLSFTLAYIDIDNFKNINDSMGHAVGDEILRTFVRTTKNHIRRIDIIARLGGDEFAIFFPDTDQAQSNIIITKLRSKLLNEAQDHHWPISFSIGVITCIDIPASIDELIKQADHTMYAVKHNGKDAIQFATYKVPVL